MLENNQKSMCLEKNNKEVLKMTINKMQKTQHGCAEIL